ncbi:hypothetical protein [Nocardia asteroides]|uniref:hypothetical protein n=1 Tax=Nocardia asteroides TaxID=1824 RepID=UPI0033E9E828
MTRRTLTLTCDQCGYLQRRDIPDGQARADIEPGWHAELAAEGWTFGAGDSCPACSPVPLTITEEITA